MKLFHIEVLVDCGNDGDLLSGVPGKQWRKMRPSGNEQPYTFTEDVAQAYFRTYNNERPGMYRIVPVMPNG